MPTDIDRAVQYGLATAAVLEQRAASVKKLAEFSKVPLTVGLDPESVHATAELLRTYAATMVCMDNTIALRTGQVRELEAALAEGLTLATVLRNASLEELTAFWRRQQEKKS